MSIRMILILAATLTTGFGICNAVSAKEFKGYEMVMTGSITSDLIFYQQFELRGTFALADGTYERRMSGFGYELTLLPGLETPTQYKVRTAPIGGGYTRKDSADITTFHLDFGPSFKVNDNARGTILESLIGEKITLTLFPYCSDTNFTDCEAGAISGGFIGANVSSQRINPDLRIVRATVKFTPLN